MIVFYTYILNGDLLKTQVAEFASDIDSNLDNGLTNRGTNRGETVSKPTYIIS